MWKSPLLKRVTISVSRSGHFWGKSSLPMILMASLNCGNANRGLVEHLPSHVQIRPFKALTCEGVPVFESVLGYSASNWLCSLWSLFGLDQRLCLVHLQPLGKHNTKSVHRSTRLIHQWFCLCFMLNGTLYTVCPHTVTVTTLRDNIPRRNDCEVSVLSSAHDTPFSYHNSIVYLHGRLQTSVCLFWSQVNNNNVKSDVGHAMTDVNCSPSHLGPDTI